VKPRGSARAYGFAPKILPPAVTFLLALVSAVPLDIPDYAAVTPSFVLMSVYHWTLYRPEHLSYLAVFLIGLFFDLLTTAPGAAIGVTPLLLLVARWAVQSSRRNFVGSSFAFVWFGFALLTGAVALASWALASLLTATLFDPRRFAFQAVLTVAVFPAADWLLARLQRATEALA
jgi:rod shape-determining protein MreD